MFIPMSKRIAQKRNEYEKPCKIVQRLKIRSDGTSFGMVQKWQSLQ